MTRKELQEAISVLGKYGLFAATNRPAFETILEAAEAHLETLPETKTVWGVDYEDADGKVLRATTCDTPADAIDFISRNYAKVYRKGFVSVSVVRDEVPA